MAIAKLTSVISNAMREFIPKQEARKSKYPSWFSRELKRLLRIKSHCNRMYTKTKLNVLHVKFSVYRALVKRVYETDKLSHSSNVAKRLTKKSRML